MDLEKLLLKPKDLSRNARGQISHNAYVKLEARKFKIKKEEDERRFKAEEVKRKFWKDRNDRLNDKTKSPLRSQNVLQPHMNEQRLDKTLDDMALEMKRKNKYFSPRSADLVDDVIADHEDMEPDS